MAKIETAKYSDLLRRWLSMAGVSSVSSELSPEISPVFVLENSLPEWAYLKNEKLLAFHFSVGADAILRSTARMRNATATGVIAVCTHIVVSTNLLTNVNVFRNEAGPLPNPTQIVARDTRWGSLETSALTGSQDNVAPTGDFFLTWRLAANSPQTFPMEFVLTPGFSLDVGTDDANVAMRGAIFFRERRMAELERGLPD